MFSWKIFIGHTSSDSNTPLNSNDLGVYIGRKCTDEQKYLFLKNRWIPEETHSFPISGKRNLKFQRKWLFEFQWLSYSKKLDGALCHFCVLFGQKEVGKGAHTAAKALVTRHFDRWKDAKELFRHHEGLLYHNNAVVSSQNFIDVHEKKKPNVSLQLNTAKRNEIELNRKILSSIIQTIIFCGRQDISLRGHRDSGVISCDMPHKNDGNFRSLLRFRMDSGDEILKQHIEKTKNVWTSPLIQNDLIKICGDIILEKIIMRVHEAKYFSILADGTTDISGIEQFSVCVRYVEEVAGHAIVREDFLKFEPIVDATGLGLSSSVMSCFNSMTLDLKYCCGQGYDGASSMSGQFQGCATRITADHPQIPYVHCISHSFNLAVSDTCKIPLIRNSLGTINEIINFFRCSAKRQAKLNEAVNEIQHEIKKKRLQKFCETRWVERFDSIITFNDFFTPIFNALEDIYNTGNDESSKKAFMFQQSIKNGGFIVTMIVINEIFSLAEPLSVSLQAKNIDLAAAVNMADDLNSLLNEMRENAELKFHELFSVAERCAKEIGEEIKTPRTASRQKHRVNIDSNSTEDYYRVAVYIPFIDHFIIQLQIRFLKHKNILSTIQNILPKMIVNLNEEAINESIDSVLKQWPEITIVNDNIVKKEALLWKQKWLSSDQKPQTFIDAFNLCDKNVFQNVNAILKVCATLPVTIATPERSFSSLKRIKTYLRNSIGEYRLNGLAHLSIHRDIPITVEEVANKFAEKNRTLAL